jgi:Ca-activated chloride channel homolog
MIHFTWHWMFLIIPLPWIVRWLLARSEQLQAALWVPRLQSFALGFGEQRQSSWRHRLAFVVATFAWLALVTAAARPQWIGDPISLPIRGRDLLMAVDLSGSMQTPDFVLNNRSVNRLEAIKSIAGDFIERRVGDRVGLIVFGSQAYLQTPLTFDRTTVNSLLQETAIGLAGDATAIGDAIGIAIKRLRAYAQSQKVLILLTDGANTAGEIEPLKAAELAAQDGVTIYTIGIGADEMTVPSIFGNRRVNPSADLDEKTMTAIADATGGRYFRARDTQQLEQIYQEVDKLQPVEQEKQVYRPQKSLFHWPLSVALILASLLLFAQRIAMPLTLSLSKGSYPASKNPSTSSGRTEGGIK